MLKVDLHTHTINSGDGLNTLYEMAQEASNRGLKILGTGSHGPYQKNSYPIEAYSVFDRIPKELFGVRILPMIEMNVLDEKGTLDVRDSSIKHIKARLCGLHFDLGGKEQNTRALIEAIKNPHVQIITHPYCYFETDIEEIAEAACQHGKLLELNNSTFKYSRGKMTWLEQVRKMIAVVRKHNHFIIINSDAHIASDIGEDMSVLEHKDTLGLTDKMIINNDLALLEKHISRL